VYARAVEPRETDEVADAIADHYHPRFSDDEIPGTFLSQLLALADKLDTLAALFAIGAVPTGSADPFGLRREAAGVVSILIGADLFVSTRRLLEVALVKLEEQTELTRPRNDIIEDVLAFIGQRLENTLRDEGIRYDLVDAALAVGVDPLRMAYERAHALRRVSAEPYFLETVIACTRPMNISKGFDDANKEVDEKLLEERGEPAEKALWAAYKKVHGKVKDKVLIGQELDDLFGDITAFLVDPIDRFFTDVLVMHEDPALRRNRLALCWSLSKLFRRLADFSLIVQT
jgi:glycyl-tRNA synthetase beta chain